MIRTLEMKNVLWTRAGKHSYGVRPRSFPGLNIDW